MVVEAGSMWRVESSFPAVGPGTGPDVAEKIESGSLVLVVRPDDPPEPGGSPRIQFRLSNRAYWAYERDFIVSARSMS